MLLLNPLLPGGGDWEAHAFPNGIRPKVNALAWLEFELAYYDVAVQDFSHDTTGHLNNPGFVQLCLVKCFTAMEKIKLSVKIQFNARKKYVTS